MKVNMNKEEVWKLNNASIIIFFRVIRPWKKACLSFYGHSTMLQTSHYDGFHQDDKQDGGIRLSHKIMCSIEFAIFCKFKLKHEHFVKMSEDACLICVICFDDTNCKNYLMCSHRGVVNEHPSVTIVVDLHEHQDPYEIAAIGLKVLGEAIVNNATMNNVKFLFEKMCEVALS